MHDGCEIPCHDFSPDWNIVTNNSGTTWLNGVALASLTSFTSSLPTLIWAHYLSQQRPHHKSERLFCLLFFRDWKSNQLNTELTRLIPARQRRNRKTSRGTATRTLFPVSLAQDFLISAADDTVNPTLAWVSETLLVCVWGASSSLGRLRTAPDVGEWCDSASCPADAATGSSALSP